MPIMEALHGSSGARSSCTSSAPECGLSQACPIGSGTTLNGATVRIESRPFPSLLTSSGSRNHAPRGMALASGYTRLSAITHSAEGVIPFDTCAFSPNGRWKGHVGTVGGRMGRYPMRCSCTRFHGPTHRTTGVCSVASRSRSALWQALGRFQRGWVPPPR